MGVKPGALCHKLAVSERMHNMSKEYTPCWPAMVEEGGSEGVFGRVDAPAPDDRCRDFMGASVRLEILRTRRSPRPCPRILRVRATRFLDMEAHKRKRDEDGTVVTFYAPNRTFARVYKGASSSVMQSSCAEM